MLTGQIPRGCRIARPGRHRQPLGRIGMFPERLVGPALSKERRDLVRLELAKLIEINVRSGSLRNKRVAGIGGLPSRRARVAA
jgi:hypothetical protein